MTTGIGPYVVPEPIDSDPAAAVLETTIVASHETYNGAIPGPTLRLNVGEAAIVRLVNNLPYPTGIHWHGIELANSADGTEVTRGEVPGAPLQLQAMESRMEKAHGHY
jgi:FtsP/CotA-like multicopper oxidase with cupredoxin domain